MWSPPAMLAQMLQVEGKCMSTKDTPAPAQHHQSRTTTCGSTAPLGDGPGRQFPLAPAVVNPILPVLSLASTEPLYKLIRAGGPHARAVAVHARFTVTLRTPTIRTLRTATLRTPTLLPPRQIRPRRDPHRYAKPPLDHIAATTTPHVRTTCAAPGFRAAEAFVFLLEALFVGVAGKLTASQVPLAVAQRAAPLGSGAVGMQTLAPARAMPFRSQGMTSTAALRPLMF